MWVSIIGRSHAGRWEVKPGQAQSVAGDTEEEFKGEITACVIMSHDICTSEEDALPTAFSCLPKMAMDRVHG